MVKNIIHLQFIVYYIFIYYCMQYILYKNFFQELVIFGRDVSKIPCFRNSFLYGITGGLGSGLLYFLFTSKPIKAVNYSVYSFSIITVGYWVQCRYLYSKRKFEMMQLQEQLKNHAMLEGTDDPNIKNNVEVVEI